MMTDENKPIRCRDRARGLIAVWEEERRGKMQINNYLPPGHSRAETLQILMDMATRIRPGDRLTKALTQALEEGPCNMESTRTQWRQAGPNSQGGEPPQGQPVLWPQCLGRGFCVPPSVEPYLPMCIASSYYSPIPVPSSDSDTGSSRPPFLESITRPESSYEASISSSMD